MIATLRVTSVAAFLRVALVGGVATGRVTGGRGRLTDRTDPGPDGVREHEGRRHPEEEAHDPGRRVHASS